MKLLKRAVSLTIICIMLFTVCITAVSAAKAPTLLMLGDSIAYGQGLTNPKDACYGRIVANTNKYSYINDAISGTTSRALLLMLSDSLIQADVKSAKIIMISTGGNDFLTKNWIGMGLKGMATGNYSKFDSIAKDYEKTLTSIVKKIKSLNPKATVIVQTVYNPHNDKWHDAFQQGVDRLNKAISNVQKATKAFKIADVASVINGHSEYIAIDTIHPNAKGNIAIAKYMLKLLKNLKLGTQTTPVIKVQPKSIIK